MKFRGIKVKPVTVTARSPKELDKKLSTFKDIYDLQFSTHFESKDSAYWTYYCALILVEVK